MKINRLLTATAAAALVSAIAAPSVVFAQATTAPPTAGVATTATDSAASTTATTAAPAARQVAPAGDLIETARASGQFTTFIKAADATNLTSVLKTNKNLTVFAPTDAAFAALPAGKLDALMADKPALQKLLTHHVINASVDSSKIAGKKGPVTSVANDAVQLDGSEGVLKADNANIIQADVRATNGILHVVDQVLMPQAATASASSAASGDAAPASATATESSSATVSEPSDSAASPAAKPATPPATAN